MWEYNLITNNNNQKLYIFKIKIKTRCKIFLLLYLIFRLSLSSGHFQWIKLIKWLFTKYKSKLIRVTMVTIHLQLTVSNVLWMFITVAFMHILFRMFSVIIYRHNQLKCYSWTDFFWQCSELAVSNVLWMFITVAFMCILFRMSSIII